jgi:membrane protein DedA with SNARE-associated domain
MMLESMIAPVPSEAVMPFAGFLIASGEMTWGAVIIASTLGSIAGSLLSYYIGRNFGRPFVIRYGKCLLLNERHLELAERFFQKYGNKTIFISRFIPIVRHFISLPAGAARMNVAVFSLYTILGAAMWNTFLTYLGFRLGSDWEVIRAYSEKLDILVGMLIIIGVGYMVYKSKKKRNGSKSA